MKKNFMKKMSAAVAMALTVTTIVPGMGGEVKAAGTQSISADSVTLYKGSSYDFNVKNSSTALYSYTYTSADTGVAVINSKSGIVSAKSNGTSKITCKIVDKKTKKTLKTLSAAVTIVDKMAANTKEITLDEQETFDINMNKTLKTVYSYRYATSDQTVATVTSTTGIVTGIKEGNATITLTVTNKNTKKTNKISIPVKVQLGKLRIAANQTHANKIELTLKSPEEVTSIKAEDIMIKDPIGVPNYIKEAKLSADKKSVTVTTYSNFSNDTKYTVTYKDASAEFTAKVGEAAKITVENQTVQAGTPTKLKIVVLDANGIDITSDDELEKISVTAAGDYSYINDEGKTKEITIYNIGNKATVTAKYNSGKYSDTGVETVIESNKAVINSVEKLASVVNFVAYSAVKENESGKTVADWDKVNHTIPADSVDYKLMIKATDENGDKIDETPTFESKDTNILTVDENDGNLYPQTTGTAYVKVTVKDVSQVFAITVGKKSVFASLIADKSSVTVSDSNKDGQTVKFKAIDQYGNDITESVSFKSDSIDGLTIIPDKYPRGTTYVQTSKSSGTDTAKVTAELDGVSLSRTFTVKSVSPGSNTTVKTYKPIYSANTIDIGKDEHAVDIRIECLNSAGIKVKNAPIKEIKLKAPNGQMYSIDVLSNEPSVPAIGTPADTVTGSSLIQLNAFNSITGDKTVSFGINGSNDVSPMLGTYHVTVVVEDAADPSKTQNVNSSIIVKNSATSVPTITIENSGTVAFDSVSAVTSGAIAQKFFSAKIDGSSVDVKLNDFTINDRVDTPIEAGGEYKVKVKSLALNGGRVLSAYNRTLNIKVKEAVND